MADIFLTGNQGQSTNQPAGPSIAAIPSWDGSAEGLGGTINALVDAVRQLSGQIPASGADPIGGAKFGAPGNIKTGGAKDDKVQKFTEINRTTKNVKITNPEDDTQFVIVQQITSLTMQDNVTKEKWIWKL